MNEIPEEESENFHLSIDDAPEGIEITSGWCTAFALASGMSYAAPVTPAEAFSEIYTLALKTPMEDTPLAEIAQREGLPPLVDYDGGSSLAIWLETEHVDVVLSYLNSLLEDKLHVRLFAMRPQTVDEAIIELRETVLEGFPVVVSANMIDTKTEEVIGHSLLISPYSTESRAVVHDSNCDGPEFVPWEFLEDLAHHTETVGVGEDVRMELNLEKPMIGIMPR